MATSNRKIGSLLDIGLVASLTAFIVVLVTGNSSANPLTSVLLIALALMVTSIGIWRETSKEQQLDEVQLAGLSFGARWGISVVIFVSLLATFLAPLQNIIEFAASTFEMAEGAAISASVRLFILGLITAMVIELSTKFVAAAIWRRSKR
ncbi:MAG: hypothetical protein ABJN65_01050 [Parasphingorhabdus sp.]